MKSAADQEFYNNGPQAKASYIAYRKYSILPSWGNGVRKARQARQIYPALMLECDKLERCPLCLNEKVAPLFGIESGSYFECNNCDLLVKLPKSHLPPIEEKKRYEYHTNASSDSEYVAHLNRLRIPLLSFLKSEPPFKEHRLYGLDYGCGPAPVLAEMIAQDGYSMDNYDPFFAPGTPAHTGNYHFITCSETAEHFSAPRAEFLKINSWLAPGGFLAIMTNFREGPARRNSQWWYLRDPTHKVFYSQKTLGVIAELHQWELLSCADDVAIFKKNSLP